ncbi:MAG TPA: substrate-binding domain-containing protein [Anaerolineae bacterium]|nr:substrate-binding domain-containing protein [Anaerolineae bacterium]HQK15488.1 substrate-binding domain-containing protein [Anaerolineae bacterium]
MKDIFSRRDFLRATAVAAAGGFLVGCGVGPKTTPTVAATTAAPAAATEAATEAATKVPSKLAGIGEGVKIVFFPGGPPGCPFGTVVYNGAVAAAADTGAEVSYMFSDWNTEKMVTQFKEAMATNPDGIAVMGHPGDDAFEGPIDEAFSKGIIVTSQNTTLPRIEAKYKGMGFGYVGQELYESGFLLGQEAVKRSGLGPGTKAMVWGLLSQPTRGLRTKGVIDALEKAGFKVDYLEIDDATNADPAAGTAIFSGYVSANPDVKLVCTDHGGLTSTLETYLTAAGKGPDDIYGIGFDLSAATVAAIRGGWTDLVLDQQPFLQGYLPIVQICLTKKFLFSGLHIDTGSGFAHKDNIDKLAPLAEKQIR